MSSSNLPFQIAQQPAVPTTTPSPPPQCPIVQCAPACEQACIQAYSQVAYFTVSEQPHFPMTLAIRIGETKLFICKFPMVIKTQQPPTAQPMQPVQQVPQQQQQQQCVPQCQPACEPICITTVYAQVFILFSSRVVE